MALGVDVANDVIEICRSPLFLRPVKPLTSNATTNRTFQINCGLPPYIVVASKVL